MPLQSAVGYSENLEDSYAAGLEMARTVLSHLTLQKNAVGLLFCNVHFEFTELLQGIGQELPIPLVGCTTAAEVNSQGFFEESASLIVLTADDVSFGLGIADKLSVDAEKAVRYACDSALQMIGNEPVKLVVTFPDTTLKISADGVLKLVDEIFGGKLPIVGGVPGDNFTFTQAYQFYNSQVFTDSIPILLLAGNVDPIVVTRSGWVPTGRKARVTKACGNLLFDIDDKPALEYLQKYIPTENDPEILGSYPLAVHMDTGEGWVIRSPHSYNHERQCIVYQGDIPQNAIVQLAYGTREDILHGVAEATTALCEHLAGRKPDCILLFSCGGRKLMLGLDTKKEIELIRRALHADIPINGFYSYGELAPLDDKFSDVTTNQFHNCTLVLCAL